MITPEVQTLPDHKSTFSLLDLEKRTGKTVYELFAACYLAHHLVREDENGQSVPCPNAPMHGEMCTRFRHAARAVLVAPAKYAKSTWTSFIQPLTDAVLGLVKGDILLISNTGRLAEHWLSLIKEEIEHNRDIINDYGRLKSEPWRQDHIKLKTGINIVSLGLNYQIRGTGWAKVIGDDLEDDEMVRSEDQREKFSDWFDGALLGRMHPHTQISLTGTFLHPLCKIKKMYDNVEGKYTDWDRILFQALDDKGESTWPERWPTEYVLKQRIEMGEKAFQAEKMNAPIFGADHVFRSEWIQYYDSKPANLFIVTSLDASSGKSDDVGDYTALTVWGLDFQSKNIYLLACERGRWATYDKVRAVFNYDQAFNPTQNLMEWEAFGNELGNVIKKEAQQQRRHVPYRLIRPDKNKERRAMAVTDLFQQHKIFFPKRGAERLIDELLMFPFGDYDDFVDSTSQALNFLRRQRPRLRHRKQIHRVQLQPNAAGRLT